MRESRATVYPQNRAQGPKHPARLINTGPGTELVPDLQDLRNVAGESEGTDTHIDEAFTTRHIRFLQSMLSLQSDQLTNAFPRSFTTVTALYCLEKCSRFSPISDLISGVRTQALAC